MFILGDDDLSDRHERSRSDNREVSYSFVWMFFLAYIACNSRLYKHCACNEMWCFFLQVNDRQEIVKPLKVKMTAGYNILCCVFSIFMVIYLMIAIYLQRYSLLWCLECVSKVNG